MKVFYPVGYDPKPFFADMEEDNIIEYIPVDEYGNVMREVTIAKGESIHIAGKKALKGNDRN